jgi:hypothetical protein
MTKLAFPPFRVGDKVTSRYDQDYADEVRTVTDIIRYPGCQSGWLVSASGSDECPTCGHQSAPAINSVDSGWFVHHKPQWVAQQHF